VREQTIDEEEKLFVYVYLCQLKGRDTTLAWGDGGTRGIRDDTSRVRAQRHYYPVTAGAQWNKTTTYAKPYTDKTIQRRERLGYLNFPVIS
jgi:hypothetical protein|tara:strand:+ start:626 stop:898 length:273 start_codon:yes stop_codon:yes gene_type:complete